MLLFDLYDSYEFDGQYSFPLANELYLKLHLFFFLWVSWRMRLWVKVPLTACVVTNLKKKSFPLFMWKYKYALDMQIVVRLTHYVCWKCKFSYGKKLACLIIYFEQKFTRPTLGVRLFALLGAENAHIRNSWRKIAFGSTHTATFW